MDRAKKKRKTKPRTKLFWKRFKEHVIFCLNIATMHGLIHIVRHGRHNLEKILWCGLVIGGATVATIQALQVWQHYQTRPVVISLERDNFNWKSTFAGITICQKKISKKTKDYKSLKEEYGITKNDTDFEDYLYDLVFGNYFTYKDFEKYANGSRRDYLPASIYVELVQNISNRISLDSGKSTKSQKTTHPFSVVRPFNYIFTEYGPCNTYNLELAAYFNPENYNTPNITTNYEKIVIRMNETSTAFGTKSIFSSYSAFLDSPNEIIDITSKFYSARDVSYQLIEFFVESVLTSKDLRQLTVEQRNCRFTNEAENLKHSPVYSYKICRMECRIELCLKYCKCTPYYYRRLSGEAVCNMTGLYCLSKYADNLIALTDPKTRTNLCPCLQNCNYHNVKLINRQLDSWFMDTFFQISYKTFPVVRYKRTLIFTKSDVLVQIGGLFGLFLGCSILSIIEIPYFFTLRFIWGVLRKKAISIDSNQ